ncbi:PasA protein [Pseudomonas fluorescens]|nr:PasA protein [Pseudomonas fluorescens]
MAHELYTRTNQKIYFAGLSLEALTRAEDGRAMNSPALLQAGRESALFHLYGALLGLCHEIAGFYRLPQANASRAELLLTREVLETIAIPELAEMVELAHNPETWLAKLLAAHAALFEPPRAPRKPKGDVTQPLIVAVNLDEQEPEQELSREELEGWRQNLKSLAIRFREGLNEC